MESARREDAQEILDLYSLVIDVVNASTVRLGWNIKIYPDRLFIGKAIAVGEMFILRKDGRIVAAAAVNRKVNPEYDGIDWKIKVCARSKTVGQNRLAQQKLCAGSKTVGQCRLAQQKLCAGSKTVGQCRLAQQGVCARSRSVGQVQVSPTSSLRTQ